MTKKCSKCKLIKPKTEFRKNINSKDGFQSYCKRCANKYSNEWASKEENKIKRKIQSQNKRAEKEGLKHDLTIEQWNRILTDFNGQCSLTNSTERVCLEHFVPLSIKAGGTTIGNVYPITENLNMSKGRYNPFWWIKFQSSEIKDNFFNVLVPYLANQNNMTVKEYTNYVNDCYRTYYKNGGSISEENLNLSPEEELDFFDDDDFDDYDDDLEFFD